MLPVCSSFVPMLHHRWKDGCQHATMWPYPRDAIYFRLLAVLSSLCWFAVFAIEAYGIWFVVFANENSVRDKYGVLGECNWCTLAELSMRQCSGAHTLNYCWRCRP